MKKLVSIVNHDGPLLSPPHKKGRPVASASGKQREAPKRLFVRNENKGREKGCELAPTFLQTHLTNLIG